jgi:hypothetical protein
MGKKSKAIVDFQNQYQVAEDEVWEVHGTTWVVKHKALERIAVEVGIVWDKPELKVCDMTNGFVAILISGKLGDHVEFSFGEASPKNNKNAYPVAMAEKRAKDRVILKLLACSGEIYSSEDDIPEPEKRQNPHVTRTEDVFEEIDKEHIPQPSAIIEAKGKAKSRDLFTTLQDDLWRQSTHEQLKYWGTINANRIGTMHEDFQQMLRGVFKEHWDAIEQLNMDDERRMAS